MSIPDKGVVYTKFYVTTAYIYVFVHGFVYNFHALNTEWIMLFWLVIISFGYNCLTFFNTEFEALKTAPMLSNCEVT